MKKISIIILISLSLLLTSCFNKEEKAPIVEVPKNENQNTQISVETNTWNTTIIETSTWEVNIPIKKSKNIKNNTNKSTFTASWKTNIWTWEVLNNSWSTDEIIEEDAKKLVLINASISDEKEELSSEEKEFMKNEVDEIDTDSLVRFKNSIYCMDKNNVYFLIYWLNKLIWVNPKLFKVLQPDWYYWTNWSGIYILDKKIDTVDFDTLKFTTIRDNFIVWWDKNNLYMWSRWIFEWWDINSLKYVSENCLKDNISVYCSFAEFGETKWWDSYDIVEWADSSTYEALDYSYSKDKYGIYFEWEIMDWVDIDSFKVFKNSLFAKDKNSVYYEWQILNWIKDINSFIAINWIPQDENCFYKIDNVENTATCETE